MTKIQTAYYSSTVGTLILGSANGRLCMCDWTHSRKNAANMRRISRILDAEFVEGESEVLKAAICQLDEYFAGSRQAFSIPLELCGTEFQVAVWRKLQTIPYGTTASYLDIAGSSGNPRSARATALAIASNAISIIIPCHRIIGKDGSITGYAGGLCAKQSLLKLESDNTQQCPIISGIQCELR